MNEPIRILVADDEAIIRSKVVMMLADRFVVDQAETAESAAAAAESGYDAILMDIVFPDGNGIDICRRIKAGDPHSTVVISSSLESVDAWNEAFKAGADGYLEKRELLGLHPRKLGLMITNLVERNLLRRQAEELNRRQAELLSVLSHDVRSPFQALLGTIELLRKSNIPADAAANVETLYQCARDQLAFINSLLELLRLESGFVGLRPIMLSVNLPVHQAVQGFRILAEAKDISLELDLQPDVIEIEGDIGRISQVVGNLLTNAIKFTPPGGKVVVRTRSSELEGHPAAQIIVEDTGVGIAPSEKEKIFQRFHRGRDSGTSGERGTGLGLCISREITQLHGGVLDVAPRPSGGSTFVACFPQRLKASEPVAARRPQGPIPTASDNGRLRRSCAGDQLTDRRMSC